MPGKRVSGLALRQRDRSTWGRRSRRPGGSGAGRCRAFASFAYPATFRAIVNAHYKIDPPPASRPFSGCERDDEWLFAFPGRLSVTISGADRLIATPREELAAQIWSESGPGTEVASPLPAWQIIKEKRATFAATPEEEARRPNARSGLADLLLAGDWTNTGVSATIEGAIRSGFSAANVLLANG